MKPNNNIPSQYEATLLKNGYTKGGISWFTKRTNDNIHFAWIWKSSNSMKMVGYKKNNDIEAINLNTDEEIYGEKQYFVSPSDKMDNTILQDFITKNVL